MRVEALSRELHRQAGEAQEWATPTMGQLRARRTALRRRRGIAGTAALVVVLGIVLGGVVTGVAGWPEGSSTLVADPPAPSTTPGTDEVVRLRWQPARCAPPSAGGCAMPYALSHGGRRYTFVAGGEQPMVGPNGVNRVMTYSFDSLGEGGRLLLVGARHGGRGSRIVLTADGRELGTDVGGGALRLLRLPRTLSGPVEIRLRERGDVDADEILSVGEYTPAP